MVVPEGMTLHPQVSNVVVNKMFRHHLKQLYSEWLLTSDHVLTSAGRIVNPSETLCFLVDHKVLAPKMIVKGYKEGCTSNAMDGTDDNILWNNSEDGNVRSEYEEDEDTDCEDGDCDTDW